MEQQPPPKPPLVPRWMWGLLCACIVLSAIVVAVFAGDGEGPLAAWGSVMQGLAGSIALVLVWRTLDLQREELQAQREEMQRQSAEFRESNVQTQRLADNAAKQAENLAKQAKLIQAQMDRPIQPFLNFYRGDDEVIVQNDGDGRAFEVRLSWKLDGQPTSVSDVVAAINGVLGGSLGPCSVGTTIDNSMLPQGHRYNVLNVQRGTWVRPDWPQLAKRIEVRIDCCNLRERPLYFARTLDRLRPRPQHV